MPKAWQIEAAILSVSAGLTLGGNAQAATSGLDLSLRTAPPGIAVGDLDRGDLRGAWARRMRDLVEDLAARRMREVEKDLHLTSHNFTADGITITTAGFTNYGFATAATLLEKNGGGDELGLALTNDLTNENEISGSHGISNVVRFDPFVPLQTGSEESSDNVLIAEADPTVMPATVSEPSTWATMLLGFVGLGFAFHRSRRKLSLAPRVLKSWRSALITLLGAPSREPTESARSGRAMQRQCLKA